MHENASVRLQRENVEPKAGAFGYAQPSGKDQVQHRTISDPSPIDRPGCIEQRLDLQCGEVAYQPRVGPLHRDGEDALNLFEGQQFRCMAFAQLTYRESLRDIATCLRSQSSASSAVRPCPLPTRSRTIVGGNGPICSCSARSRDSNRLSTKRAETAQSCSMNASREAGLGLQ